MPEQPTNVEADRQALLAAKQKGVPATVATYLRLSGPGWLQSALTLGGGSLASSLFLGVLAGFGLLWLQPFAMILGIFMLGAIGYVAMSTNERPFQAINRHINPVLGWGWALASLAANMVWALPQYSLASGVLQQNLLPTQLGSGSTLGTAVGNAFASVFPGAMGPGTDVGDFGGKIVISAAILIITMAVTFTYDSGGWGIKLYELMLKFVVAGIVACFVGVVGVLAFSGTLPWAEICRGFIPDLTKLYQPAEGFNWLLDQLSDAQHKGFWIATIISEQRDVMISAAATAVGINMTFLLPYSMLRRGWDKDFRGLAIFDLSTGMFIPFVLATSCVVIASATQFHPHSDEQVMIGPENPAEFPAIPASLTESLQQGKLEQSLGTQEFKKLSPPQIAEKLPPLTSVEIEITRRLAAVKSEPAADPSASVKWGNVVAVKEMMVERLKERLGNLEAAKLAPVARKPMTTILKYDIGGALVADLQPQQLEAQLQPLDQADFLLAAHLKGKDAFALAKKMEVERLKTKLGKEEFGKLSDAEIEQQVVPLTPAEALLAVHLQRKNAFDLAKSLTPLTGRVVADVVFGIGVLGMTVSSITLLMLISGFVICEMLGLPPTGWPNRLGTLAAATGVLGPFLWSGTTRFWLAVPTSVFGMILLPIAYITFFCMMNSKNLLGDQMPRGVRRAVWNLAMGIAVAAAGSASVYMVWVKAGVFGLVGVAAFLLLVLAVHFAFPRNRATN